MASYFHVFNDNRTAIVERVLGATMRHCLYSETKSAIFTEESLWRITYDKYRRDCFVAHFEDTLTKMSSYFETLHIGAAYSDFQAQLALDLHKDYIRV